MLLFGMLRAQNEASLLSRYGLFFPFLNALFEVSSSSLSCV